MPEQLSKRAKEVLRYMRGERGNRWGTDDGAWDRDGPWVRISSLPYVGKVTIRELLSAGLIEPGEGSTNFNGRSIHWPGFRVTDVNADIDLGDLWIE